jgi:hypothetical protein
MTNILLTLTVFLLSLSNLWLWIKVCKLEDLTRNIITILKTHVLSDFNIRFTGKKCND